MYNLILNDIVTKILLEQQMVPVYQRQQSQWTLSGDPFTICLLPCKICTYRGRILGGTKLILFSQLDQLLITPKRGPEYLFEKKLLPQYGQIWSH